MVRECCSLLESKATQFWQQAENRECCSLLESKATQQFWQQAENRPDNCILGTIIVYVFARHTFMTRNLNQTTTDSPSGVWMAARNKAKAEYVFNTSFLILPYLSFHTKEWPSLVPGLLCLYSQYRGKA